MNEFFSDHLFSTQQYWFFRGRNTKSVLQLLFDMKN